jgi:hypothetical protein
MNHDQIEPSLREPGPLERGYQPVALPAEVADARPAGGWKGSLLAVGRLGMVVAAVAGGAALAIMLSRSPAPGGRGVGAGGTTHSPAASQAPTGAGACRAEDFAWTTDPWGGAAGSRGTTVLARGVTSLSECQIHGEAGLMLSDASGHTLLASRSASTAITVHGGTLLEIEISWSNWCGSDPAGPLSLSLTLPGDTVAVPVLAADGGLIPVPPCNGQGQPSVLNATDFQLSSRAVPEG